MARGADRVDHPGTTESNTVSGMPAERFHGLTPDWQLQNLPGRTGWGDGGQT